MKHRVAKKYLNFNIPCAHLHCTQSLCDNCVEYDEECKLGHDASDDWDDVCFCKCYKPMYSLSTARISEKQDKISWKRMMVYFHMNM